MRLVDADEIVKKQRDLIRRTCDEVYANDWRDPVILAMSSVYGIVEDAPTIDPVKHGYWDCWFSKRGHVRKCSVCGHAIVEKVPNVGALYCDSCGAKMD